jgi:phage tail sheath protein FI
MLVVDPQTAWTNPASVNLTPLGIGGPAARNAAVYFPRVKQPNALHGDQIEDFPPSGAVAGIMARTDVQRGVWKAPAGIDAALSGAVGLSVSLNDDENGQLNPLGVNCLRTFPVFGTVVWGSRTMRGADQLADEYKYIPIRRLALFIEESLFRGIQWAVFEPNDEPLWAQIRLNAGAFMQELFRQGAFQGGSPRDAYFVKCDKDTTTQADINLGIVNIIVGFAPLKPAEFVVLKIQQIAGQIQA